MELDITLEGKYFFVEHHLMHLICSLLFRDCASAKSRKSNLVILLALFNLFTLVL